MPQTSPAGRAHPPQATPSRLSGASRLYASQLVPSALSRPPTLEGGPVLVVCGWAPYLKLRYCVLWGNLAYTRGYGETISHTELWGNQLTPDTSPCGETIIHVFKTPSLIDVASWYFHPANFQTLRIIMGLGDAQQVR